MNRVREVAEFLRQQYGFGFGDTPDEVKSNNAMDLDLSAAPNGDGNFDANWTSKGSRTAPGCPGTLTVTFTSDLHLEEISHDERELSTFGCSSLNAVQQATRISQERREAQSLVVKLGIKLSAAWKNASGLALTQVYHDLSDPCFLEIELPPQEPRDHYTWTYRFRPSSKCVVVLR